MRVQSVTVRRVVPELIHLESPIKRRVSSVAEVEGPGRGWWLKFEGYGLGFTVRRVVPQLIVLESAIERRRAVPPLLHRRGQPWLRVEGVWHVGAGLWVKGSRVQG